ncbi:hypothetical protein RI054_15g74170 [Pseudoscourfieldia marina]
MSAAAAAGSAAAAGHHQQQQVHQQPQQQQVHQQPQQQQQQDHHQQQVQQQQQQDQQQQPCDCVSFLYAQEGDGDLATAIARELNVSEEIAIRDLLKRIQSRDLAPASPEARSAAQQRAKDVLQTGKACLVQRDPLATLGQPGVGMAHVTTWSLATDCQMVSNVDDVGDVNGDESHLQLQHLYGPTSGQAVLTGTATAFLHAMIFGGEVHWHGCDVVPASTTSIITKTSTGAYLVPDGTKALETEFFDRTAGFFLLNQKYSIVFLQGAMGVRAVDACAKVGKVWKANAAVYDLLGLSNSLLADATGTGRFGVSFGLRHNVAQLIVNIPSLGSMLAGPMSNGGVDTVVTVTELANMVRRLRGDMDDINHLESPLLALTTGKGRTQCQLDRVAQNLKLRNTGTYVHPSVKGGTATIESHGPQMRNCGLVRGGAGRTIPQHFRLKPQKRCNKCTRRGPSNAKHMVGPRSKRRLCGYYTEN